MIKILLIEDDVERIEQFQKWLPEDMQLVCATSAGSALGILQRDRGRVYSGILLDHDLQEQIRTDTDRYISGTNVTKLIITAVTRDVPILVHSVNITRGPWMAQALKDAGFRYVTRIPMNSLKKRDFIAWTEDVRDIWLDYQDE